MPARKDPRLDNVPRNVNEEIQDRVIRHALFLEGFKTSVQNEIANTLDESLVRILLRLDRRLSRIAERGFDTGPATTRRLQELAVFFSEATDAIRRQSFDTLRGELLDLARSEIRWQKDVIESTIPVSVEMVIPSAAALRSAVISNPMDGRLLSRWFRDATTKTRRVFEETVRRSIAEGLTFREIVLETRGTTLQRIEGGVLKTFSDDFGALTRSAITHVSAHAREALFRENDDLIKGVQWVATLDTITCPSCGALDGRIFPINKGPRPPRHINCRCTVVPVLKSFRDLGIDLDEAPAGTRASLNGQVPETITWGSWIKRQSTEIQNIALGPRRAAKLRAGTFAPKAFVDRRGNVRTLRELEALEGR